uniref:Uncharacterized protein n=1 Tax=Echeneis naucrates TaxID=173247 RepID=A0A665X977_ECHNA
MDQFHAPGTRSFTVLSTCLSPTMIPAVLLPGESSFFVVKRSPRLSLSRCLWQLHGNGNVPCARWHCSVLSVNW